MYLSSRRYQARCSFVHAQKRCPNPAFDTERCLDHAGHACTDADLISDRVRPDEWVGSDSCIVSLPCAVCGREWVLFLDRESTRQWLACQ